MLAFASRRFSNPSWRRVFVLSQRVGSTGLPLGQRFRFGGFRVHSVFHFLKSGEGGLDRATSPKVKDSRFVKVESKIEVRIRAIPRLDNVL